MTFRYYERLIGKTYAVRLDDPYLIEKRLRFQELQSTEETYKNGNVGPNKGSGNTRLQPVEFTDDNEKIIFNNSQSTNVNVLAGNTGKGSRSSSNASQQGTISFKFFDVVDTCFDYVIYAYKRFPQPNFIPTKVIYYDDYTYFQKNVFPDSLNKAFQQTAIKYDNRMTSLAKGRVTGYISSVLGDTVMNERIYSTVYYNNRGEENVIYQSNLLGGYDVTSMERGYLGNIT